MSRITMIVSLVAALLLSVACENQSADRQQRQKTAAAAAEVQARLGMPGITNYTERRFMKMILELRDTEVATWSYYLDMHGKIHFLCQSIGYGLPYSTQYTNPMKRIFSNSAGTIPQQDPNQLWSADSVAATWIICAGEEGKPQVVYWEPDLVVSPFPLQADTNLKAEAKPPS